MATDTRLLVDFLNLYHPEMYSTLPEAEGEKRFKAAEKFITRHSSRKNYPAELLIDYARQMRGVWSDLREGWYESADKTLTRLLKAGDPSTRRKIRIDTGDKGVTFYPVSLSDRLMIEMVTSWKTLNLCPECEDFYLPSSSSGNAIKYCGDKCRIAVKNRNESERIARKRALQKSKLGPA